MGEDRQSANDILSIFDGIIFNKVINSSIYVVPCFQFSIHSYKS